jgi:hypothetical protein
LKVVQQAMEMIRDVEALIPDLEGVSFRERLLAQMEQGSVDTGFLSKAGALLAFLEMQFGVNDFLDQPAQGTAGR